MLIRPPKPPNPSIRKARPVASTIGRSQGSAPIQPKRPLAAAQPAGDLQRRADSEDGEQRRHRDERGQRDLQELEGVGLLRVHEQVMHARPAGCRSGTGRRSAAHRVAVKPPAGGLRHHRVEGDVGRDQPEVDDRVQRPREERAREADVDSAFRPSAAGMTWKRSSTATPTVVHSHMTALATVANIASGTGRPGLARFHWPSPRASARTRSTTPRRPARGRCRRRRSRSAADRR